MEHISKFLEKHKVNVECKCDEMNKYKVELKQVDTYTIDVLAKDEEEAKAIATEKWNEVCSNGTYHYHQEGDTEDYISYVYDVSGTDDPFSAMNCIHSECDNNGVCKVCGGDALTDNT